MDVLVKRLEPHSSQRELRRKEPAPTQVLVYHPVSLGAIPSKSSLFLMNFLFATRQATDGHAFGQSPTV